MSKPAFELVEEAVNSLYSFRDHYFINNPIEKASNKNEDVNNLLQSTIGILNDNQDECESKDKAQFYLFKGKAMNITSEFNLEALELLSKAVKLNPKLVSAWNELGECYWKKGDVQAAKNCFEGALKHSKNKVSLQNLSMVLRQLGNNHEDKTKNIQDSVVKAREAVEMDLDDGKSWYILGNAYLSLFFVGGQSPKIMKQCMTAYTKAMQDSVVKYCPDLHFNRATALKYEEDYQGALDGYEKASSYDPLWPEPNEKITHLIDYLQKVQDMVNQKGCQKPRKLRALIKNLKPQHLGPYSGGSFTNLRGQSVKLEQVPTSELKPGANLEKVVFGKVVCNVLSNDLVSFTFCMIDEEENCSSVNVYNLAQGKGVIIGDSVAIAEPYLECIHVKHKGKEFNFNSIRVDTPVVLVVNGRKLKADQQAPPTLNVTMKTE